MNAKALKTAGYTVWTNSKKNVVVITREAGPVDVEFVKSHLGEFATRAERQGGAIVVK